MKKTVFFIFLFIASVCQFTHAAGKAHKNKDILKPRVVILTDMSPVDWEPDDMESMIRLLVHADLYEIEALISTGGWNNGNMSLPLEWIEYIKTCIDAYEKDLPNLMKRSSQSDCLPLEAEASMKQTIGYWPSANYLRSRVMHGSLELGADKIGEGNDSKGSDFIIQLADEDDPRPIWVLAWGGANTLAQAIWKVKQQRSEQEWKSFVQKFYVYAITDQDVSLDNRDKYLASSHYWMRKTCGNDLHFIWDESAWMTQNEVGSNHWNDYAQNIQGHGHLGNIYPKNKYGVEGDTPSFLHVMPNGLNDPVIPDQTGWGGFFKWAISLDKETDCYTNCQPEVRSISQKYEHYFYPAVFANFAARMDWANEGKGNRNPTISINRKKGISIMHLRPKSGKEITLDASNSYDADGDSLQYKWWILHEAGTYANEISLDNPTDPKLHFTVPADAVGKTIHIICEVTDDGTPQLTSYRRIIIEAK